MNTEITPITEQLAKDNAEREAHDKRCGEMAEEIFQIMAKHRPSSQDFARNHDGMLAAYAPIQNEIALYLLSKDATLGESNYVWSIVQAMIDQTKNLTISTIQVAFERAQRKIFGVEEMEDLTLQKINDIVKAS